MRSSFSFRFITPFTRGTLWPAAIVAPTTQQCRMIECNRRTGEKQSKRARARPFSLQPHCGRIAVRTAAITHPRQHSRVILSALYLCCKKVAITLRHPNRALPSCPSVRQRAARSVRPPVPDLLRVEPNSSDVTHPTTFAYGPAHQLRRAKPRRQPYNLRRLACL